MYHFSANSTYDDFLKMINIYCDLFQKGLKKQANQYLSKMVNEFTAELPADKQADFLYQLCYNVCDRGDSCNLLKRGNGRMPYAIDKLVWDYLKAQCQIDKMPHLRWVYELYCYNPFDKDFDPLHSLQRALAHKNCDKKTIDLYFQSLVSWLAWGAHHFPEGCIIERTSYDNTLSQCHTMAEQFQLNEKQLADMAYYETLYQCYYEYTDSDKSKDFYGLCKAYGIDFKRISAYYY